MHPVWFFLNGVPVIPVVRIGVTLAGDGSASAPSYSFASSPTSGLYRISADTIGLTAAGTVRAYWSSAGLTVNALNFDTSNADVSLSRAAQDVLTTPDRFVSTGPLAGIGYATGAGGTQTQGTSKATTVVLNTITGEITMHNATLNAATIVSFTLTNSAIALGDHVIVQHVSAGTVGAYGCTAVAGAGSATVYVRNNSAGNLGEAIVLKYSVIKSATA